MTDEKSVARYCADLWHRARGETPTTDDPLEALYCAVCSQDVNGVRNALAAGAHVSEHVAGASMLKYAVLTDGGPARDEIIGLLLKAGADPASTLHELLGKGNLAIVEVFAEHGAGVETLTGRAPLLDAVASMSLELVQHVVTRCPDVNVRDKQGGTPLHFAASEPTAKILRFLLEQGAEVDAVNDVGQTPLFYAVQWEHVACAEALLEAGADFTHPTGGQSVRELARQLGFETIENYIRAQREARAKVANHQVTTAPSRTRRVL